MGKEQLDYIFEGYRTRLYTEWLHDKDTYSQRTIKIQSQNVAKSCERS